MGTKGGISLASFCVFNPTYGPREGEEHKKIVFFYPKETDIDTQIKHIGLCEAIVRFTETFSNKPCQSLHTTKRRQLFLEAEKDFWMIMTVTIPFTEKTKDGQSVLEYHEEETLRLPQGDILDIFSGIHFMPLDKNTYLHVQCFINLLEASFSSIKYTAFLYNDQLVWSGLDQEDMRIIYKYLITSLFPSYQEQELQSTNSVSPSRNSAAPGDVHYGKFITGPPDIRNEKNLGKVPRVYINTECCNEECFLLVYRAHNASVCMFLPAACKINFELCHKLDSFLGPRLSQLASDIGEQFSKKAASGFITGPPDIRNEKNLGKVPRVYINTECCNEECFLLVYRAHNASVCMFLPAACKINFELCHKLDSFLGPRLSQLASDIGEQFSKKAASGADTAYRFIYFNHMNLAQKTTVHSDMRKTGSNNIPPETLKLLTDISSDMSKSPEDGEIIVKTSTDNWVVGKKSDHREFFVVINQKNANLIEINDSGVYVFDMSEPPSKKRKTILDFFRRKEKDSISKESQITPSDKPSSSKGFSRSVSDENKHAQSAVGPLQEGGSSVSGGASMYGGASRKGDVSRTDSQNSYCSSDGDPTQEYDMLQDFTAPPTPDIPDHKPSQKRDDSLWKGKSLGSLYRNPPEMNLLPPLKKRTQFFDVILPKTIKLALSLPHLITQPIPLLKREKNKSITLSQEQIACLLANAFLCTFPRRNARGNLYDGDPLPAGVVTFTRQCVDKFPDWKNLGDYLTDIHVSAEGTIEDDGDGLLQVITATHHHTENNSYFTTL
uniref:Uncharacterized protein n=1 Tax=Magallana gigas TaxID=29159 RepID=K1PLK1_MAGGI